MPLSFLSVPSPDGLTVLAGGAPFLSHFRRKWYAKTQVFFA